MTTLPIPAPPGPLPLAVLVNPPLDELDRAALARARALVETMPLAVRIAGAVGGLVDKGLASIAGISNERVEKVARNALRYADEPAFVCGGRSLSHGEFLASAQRRRRPRSMRLPSSL